MVWVFTGLTVQCISRKILYQYPLGFIARDKLRELQESTRHLGSHRIVQDGQKLAVNGFCPNGHSHNFTFNPGKFMLLANEILDGARSSSVVEEILCKASRNTINQYTNISKRERCMSVICAISK